MPVPAELANTPSVAGPVGSLALSVVCPRAPTLALRALRWHQDLQRLGVVLPLFVVHDVGLLLACDNEQLDVAPRVPVEPLLAQAGGDAREHFAYAKIVEEIAASEAARRSQSLRMGDDLVVVVLARLLRAVADRVGEPPGYVANVPLDAQLVERLEPQLPALFRSVQRRGEVATLRAFAERRLLLLTLVDALDLDTLALFGLVGGDASAGAMAQVDLLSVLGAPEANDVVDFSLEILPSVLETRARPGSGSHAAFGYAGLSRKGSIDSLVLTELAWDEQEMLRRLLDDEVFYYSREQARDEARRVHHVLIDASASMRGDRATFARGMAVASAKQLLLAGEDVVFRFFDARLYEPHAARNGQLPVAHVLGFKGERGRNPAKVFRELVSQLEISALRDSRQPILHLYTHAALYIPRDTVAALARLAHVAAIFMLPSGNQLHLDYLDLLDAHWVVDHQALSSRHTRAQEARRILGDLDGQTQAWRADKVAVDVDGEPTSRRGGPASRSLPRGPSQRGAS
jgi:hypothetical protein